MEGVRAHSVGHAEGVVWRELCQHLQRMTSKTLQLAHGQSCSNFFPSNCLVQCGLGSIPRPESAIWWSNKIKTNNTQANNKSFIKTVKGNHVAFLFGCNVNATEELAALMTMHSSCSRQSLNGGCITWMCCIGESCRDLCILWKEEPWINHEKWSESMSPLQQFYSHPGYSYYYK